MLFALAAGLLTSAFFAGIGEDIGVLAIVSSVLAIPLIGFLIFLNTTTSSLATSGPSEFFAESVFLPYPSSDAGIHSVFHHDASRRLS